MARGGKQSAVAKDLSPEARQHMDLFKDSVDQVVGAARQEDESAFEAAWAQMSQLASNSIDYQEMLNSMHVPEDAGEYEADIRDMLARIPDGWGRWLGVGKGWYPLVTEVHRQLVELFPNYEIHQVKEKYGTLRYYWDAGAGVYESNHPSPTYPGQDSSDAEKERWQRESDIWSEARDNWWESEEGQKIAEIIKERSKLAEAIADAAEARSELICERCGQEGHMTSRGGWLATLCREHARERGASFSPDHLRVDAVDLATKTAEDARRVIERFEQKDPEQNRQRLSVWLYERDQDDRELGQEFVSTLLDWVAERHSKLAEEWDADPSSSISVGPITEQSQQLLDQELAARGLSKKE